MFWNNLGLTKKIVLFIAAMLCILLCLALVYILTINSLTSQSRHLKRAGDVSELMREREIDHLVWLNKLQAYVFSQSENKLTVQTDPHKCGLGLWYYSAGHQEAVAWFPDIGGQLAMLETPHTQLHRSADEIKQLKEAGDL